MRQLFKTRQFFGISDWSPSQNDLTLKESWRALFIKIIQLNQTHKTGNLK